MLLAIVLAASITPLSLDNGLLSLSVPSDIQVREQKVNFESAEWDLYEVGDESPLLQIVAGFASYDLHAFVNTCLNGRAAWRKENADSGMVVVGQPGGWSVAAYWQHLSEQRLAKAKDIVSSVRVDLGPEC